jgi:hypothetical protein
MADPIKSNLLSNTCGTPTSSNCVLWAGPNIPGLGTCRGASMTDIVFAIYQTCCLGGINSCYTGNWVPFVSSIPASGSGTNYSYNISAFSVGNSGTPSYKWTKEGNLALRGSFRLSVNTTVVKEYIDIVLCTIDKACAPANWQNNQGVVTFVDFFPQNNSVISTRAVVYINYATGQLVLNFTYGNIPLLPMICEIDLGGVLFNLA